MKCVNEIIVLKLIFKVMILLVSITLFCDQGRKSESLEERRKIM